MTTKEYDWLNGAELLDHTKRKLKILDDYLLNFGALSPSHGHTNGLSCNHSVLARRNCCPTSISFASIPNSLIG